MDPRDERVVRVGPDAVPETLSGDARIDLDLVLPGFTLTVRELFATLRLG